MPPSALTLAALVSVAAQGPVTPVAPKPAAQPVARRRGDAPKPVAARPVTAAALPKTDEFQPMVTRYCAGCHNTRNPLPAGAPLVLDKANLADPGADAATWERVVKKLGVGAMPPQGAPTPGAAELARFRSALVAHLDAAAGEEEGPGQVRPAPVESHRVRQRGARSAGRHHRRAGSAAERRRRLRLRQRGDGAQDVAADARALRRGRPAGRRARRRRRRRRAGHGHLHHQHRRHAEPARGRAAARHPRRHRGAAHLHGRRRVRVLRTAAEDGGRRARRASKGTRRRTTSSSRSTASRCSRRRSAARRITTRRRRTRRCRAKSSTSG